MLSMIEFLINKSLRNRKLLIKKSICFDGDFNAICLLNEGFCVDNIFKLLLKGRELLTQKTF